MPDHATIAVIAPIQPADFFDLLWQGVWEATFDLGSFGVEVQNLTTKSGDVGEQREVLKTLLDSRPDAIALLPAHGSALDDLIDEHALGGTPLIAFLGDAPHSQRAALVGADARQSGVLAGEVLAKLMNGQGRVLAFPGSLDEFHLAQRHDGFREALAHYGGRIQETCCPLAGASFDTAQELLRHGPVDGYYVGHQDLVSVASAIEEVNQGRPALTPCIGFSNTERARPLIERGTVSAVIDENRYQIGYFAVQKAYEAVLKRNDRAPVAGVQIPSVVVFAANAAAPADSLGSAFELLVRQRTEILLSYKKRLEEANAKLLDLAVTDPLTGLYNRRRFEETLNQEVARARRYGSVSLLVLDLDLFKQINDRFGHRTGDDVLKAVSHVMQACCRATDTCARLGGDEFAVILPHSDSAAASLVRKRIEQRAARISIPTAQGPLTVSLSIGQATLPGDAHNAQELFSAADTSMYQHKQAAHSLAPAPEPSAAR